jgi:hypothetical protein
MKLHWRDSVRAAADLAILGFAVTIASLPVVTAGAAVATASLSVRHFQAYETWPRFSVLAATFRSRLLRGVWAGPLFLAGLALVLLDLAGLRHGVVPGGAPMMSAVLVVAALLVGWTALVAVLGGQPRAALALAFARPPLLFSAVGAVLVAALLALLVHPVLVPLLIGYVLYALHALTARHRLTLDSENPC